MNPGNHNVEIMPVFSSGDESCSSVRLMSNVSMTMTKPAVWHKIKMREGLELIVGWVLYVLWENCGRKGKMYENNLQDWEKWLDSDGRSGTPEVFGGDDPTESWLREIVKSESLQRTRTHSQVNLWLSEGITRQRRCSRVNNKCKCGLAEHVWGRHYYLWKYRQVGGRLENKAWSM